MVHFPAYSPCQPMCSAAGAGHPGRRVTPFGHPWIVGRWHLPTAFRSCPRPSSPGGSQASSMNPSSLDHIILSIPRYRCLKIHLEAQGLEPWTLGLQSRCSSQLSHAPAVRTARTGREREAGAIFAWQALPLPGQRPCCAPPAVSPAGFPFLLRKEVIQPHLPVRLPCYDFTPLTRRTLGTAPLSVRLATSGTSGSDGVTGGVYKARERIHRAMLMRDY